MIKKLATWVSKKILNPPNYVLDVKNNFRALLAQDYREILLTEIIILFLLAASVQQMAFVFGRGQIDARALCKAIAIDGAIWLLSRLASKRVFSVAKSKRSRFFTQLFLWSGVFVLLAFATFLNSLYEIWNLRLRPGTIGFYIDQDPLVLTTKFLSSSFLAVMILFLTFVRATLTKNMIDSFSDLKAEEEREEKRVEKAREERRRLEEEKRARAERKKAKEDFWETESKPKKEKVIIRPKRRERI